MFSLWPENEKGRKSGGTQRAKAQQMPSHQALVRCAACLPLACLKIVTAPESGVPGVRRTHVFTLRAASPLAKWLAWRSSASCNVVGSGGVVEHQQLEAPCWEFGMDILLIFHLPRCVSICSTRGIR